ncbi:isochorismatase family protein [Neoroseomonas oryzicola]|uniref:Isochorismatase family protein n=1 Tax=Neoroseomonas oryzicola TaxID=535904 RepID=A0A9X9WH50_9PROT|nr:isochorismatase family protein [Neoroseomonas oryzicola]MBR0659660.1 isochorismatase family protein [Neoroseomonas oryzicola]NKE15479.1 isochorismatase family protein [Neoroseomonas oryzicola]
MARPRTLLDLAGALRDPPRLADAALVVIDAQGEYGPEGRLPLEGMAEARAALAGLLARARAAGAVVIHIAHRGKAGGLFDRDAAGGAFLPDAAPLANEAVVEKGLPNAFAGTDLQALLTQAGKPDLVLAGFMTHMCVSATARAALDLGHRVTVAGDAVASRALPDPMGGADIPGAEISRIALAELADRFAMVVRAETLR